MPLPDDSDKEEYIEKLEREKSGQDSKLASADNFRENVDQTASQVTSGGSSPMNTTSKEPRKTRNFRKFAGELVTLKSRHGEK